MRNSRRTHALVRDYVDLWRGRGYPEDIPDEVPPELMRLGLAPSYQAIACALLKNDLGLHSLGFASPVSKYYTALKAVELADRPKPESPQLEMFPAPKGPEGAA